MACITRYEVLLFLHVVGAIVWVGIVVTATALFLWADRNREYGFAAKLQEAVEWIEPVAAAAGPLLLLATGIGLVLEGPWSFTDLWVVLGIGGYTLALAIGAGYEGPGARRVNAIVRERGPEDPEAVMLARRLQAAGYVELAIVVLVVLAMATKPTGSGSAEFWIVVAAVAGAAAWLAARTYRGAALVDEPL